MINDFSFRIDKLQKTWEQGKENLAAYLIVSFNLRYSIRCNKIKKVIG